MLSFQFKKRLRDFTVDISQSIGAETLVLIGHSGCGKSTALKMLAGLLTPEDGMIKLNESCLFEKKQMINVPPEERNIGYVFQNYALFPHLTVQENVEYGINKLSKEEQEVRVEEVLNLLEIQSLANTKPAMLSGGEQQRVALARALVTRPKLLLLDEPLSALDVSTRTHVRAELKLLLGKLSIPTIVVTHDYEDARVLADRVAVMDQGKIIQSGTPKEISQFPANDFVAKFTGTNLIPLLDQETPQSCISFNPWDVEIGFESNGSEYEWQGIIRDMAWLGGLVRLQIEGDETFFAEVPVERVEDGKLKMGDHVYAYVRLEDIRMVPFSPSFNRSRNEKRKGEKRKGKVEENSKKVRKTWKFGFSVISFLMIVAFVLGYKATANFPETTKQVNMIALVAANATDPLNDLIKIFEKEHQGVSINATYAGTHILRTQLENGAKADLFLSADIKHIEAVKEKGIIEQFYPVSLNKEVIVVPKNNPANIHSLKDLGTNPVKLVIGVESVPIGRYTRQIFKNTNKTYGDQFSKKVLSQVVSLETSTKAVLQKVALGEAEAGIVYKTDVTPEFKKKVKIISIPEKYNVYATNYIAVTKNAPNPELAEELMKKLLLDKGQAVFQKYGYDSIK